MRNIENKKEENQKEKEYEEMMKKIYNVSDPKHVLGTA